MDDIETPEWIITDRNDLPEYSDFGDNAERLKNIGKVFPMIFFLVAALISLTTMTRMVEEQRTQIGTMKALGYGKASIASKYLSYAFWLQQAEVSQEYFSEKGSSVYHYPGLWDHVLEYWRSHEAGL